MPEVHAWADLTDPRLAGWISAPDPRASGSALAIYEIILQACGWDKGWADLMAMSGNTRDFLSSAAASAREVGLGDAAYGVAIDQYGQAQVAYYGKQNITFTLPEGQTVITPDSIAILKNPPHLELAQHFLDFVLSRDGQLLWMQPRGAPGGAVKYHINRMSVMPALYQELAGTSPIIAAWMIDTRDWLARAWLAAHGPAARKMGEDRQQALLAQLVAPPLSQDDVLRLADTDWKDPVKRTALINRWQGEAISRYKSVLAQIPGN